MKYYKQYDEWFRLKIKHILNNEDKVIKGHKTNNSDKMRIY